VVRALRVLAPLEACTYLVLLATLLWRVAGDGPDVSGVIGPVHGRVFVAYAVAVVLAREDTGWSGRRTLAIAGAAVVPLGGFFVARSLERGRSGPGRSHRRPNCGPR
jgi:integral membrane protein